MTLSVFGKLLLSFILGAVVGLEREIHEKHEDDSEYSNIKVSGVSFVGVRTLSLVAGMGALSGLLSENYMSLAIVISIIFTLLLVVHYAASCWITHDIGFTTELAIGYCYLIGILLTTDAIPVELTVATTVILMLVLSIKESLKNIIEGVQQRELKAFISYGLIALVILPFLPRETILISHLPYAEVILSSWPSYVESWLEFEIFSPFRLWFIVALITGVGLLGHLLKRFVGQSRGLMISSLVGGFVSSTATVQALAVQSKKHSRINSLIAASMLANAASFVSFIMIMLSVNAKFAFSIFPTVAILFFSMIATWYYFAKIRSSNGSSKTALNEEVQEIFSIQPALIFAFMYMLIKIATKIGLVIFGESGFLIAASIAGFAGIDAASISIADAAGDSVSYFIGALAFLAVNTVNLLAKALYVFMQGSKSFSLTYFITTIVLVVISFLGLLAV